MTSAKKSSSVSKKSTAHKKTVRKKTNTVDYYPNRMTFWVSAAAGSLIVLWATMFAYM